ncbi:MAG: hypothetical protein V1875_09860 [Candidatus Altiarchaeota archaeon]
MLSLLSAFIVVGQASATEVIVVGREPATKVILVGGASDRELKDCWDSGYAPERVSCYARYAFEMDDPGICDQSPYHRFDRDPCFKLLTTSLKNNTPCASMRRGNSQALCYRIMSVSDDGALAASVLGNFSAPEDCGVDCMSRIAVLMQMPEICNTMMFSRDSCFAEVAIRLNDSGVCERMLGNRGRCYSAMAMRLGNISFCDKIETPDLRLGCQIEMAVWAGDASICPKVAGINVSRGDECFMKLALGLGDASLCGNISLHPGGKFLKNDASRDNCFEEVALRLRNESVCKNIEGEKDWCIARIAKDYAMCENLEGPCQVYVCMSRLDGVKISNPAPSDCEIYRTPRAIVTVTYNIRILLLVISIFVAALYCLAQTAKELISSRKADRRPDIKALAKKMILFVLILAALNILAYAYVSIYLAYEPPTTAAAKFSEMKFFMEGGAI